MAAKKKATTPKAPAKKATTRASMKKAPAKKRVTKAKASRRKAPMAPGDLLTQLEFHKTEIAKHRDALAKLVADAQVVFEATSNGVQELEQAIASLSTQR